MPESTFTFESRPVTIHLGCDHAMTFVMLKLTGFVNDRKVGKYEAGTLLSMGGGANVRDPEEGGYTIDLEFSHRLTCRWNEFIGRDGRLFEYRDERGNLAFQPVDFASIFPVIEGCLWGATEGKVREESWMLPVGIESSPVSWRDRPPLL